MATPAQTYFNTFSPEEQNQIRASWGGTDRMQEWFDNGVRAGAVNADGTTPENPVGATQGHTDQSTADVTGTRAAAREAGMSEDFDRFDEPTLQRWEQFKAPAGECPPKFPYRQDQQHAQQNGFSFQSNACVEKPIDTGGVIADGRGGFIQNPEGQPGQQGAAPKSGSGGEEQAPAEPVTHGQQLSYTGDPMQDMLIYQFNTKATMDGRNKNIFGLGEDRAVGGEGQDADMQDVIGQTLSGGGLWWSDDESAFSNYGKPPAQKKKKAGGGKGGSAPSPQQVAAPPPAEPTPQPDDGVPGVGANMPDYKQDQVNQMLSKKYWGGRAESGNELEPFML